MLEDGGTVGEIAAAGSHRHAQEWRRAMAKKFFSQGVNDLQKKRAQRRPRNKRGFALQMCVLRSPGHLLASGKFVPPGGADFIGCRSGDELVDYGARAATRQLRKIATPV